VRRLADQAPEAYAAAIELRPNDLASPRASRRTDDLLPKLETERSRAATHGSTDRRIYTHLERRVIWRKAR